MLKDIYQNFIESLEGEITLGDLESLRVHYLGMRGLLKQQFALIPKIEDAGERKKFGQKVNKLAEEISLILSQKKSDIEDRNLTEKIFSEKIDATLPGRSYKLGRVHPISCVIARVRNILGNMGFTEVKGPDIEDEYHVFDALNTPWYHPARGMQDSFYLPNNLLLRTHTSSVQIRAMESSKPPFNITSIGKVYRNDWDTTHTPMFHQIECLCINEEVSVAHLKHCVKVFLDNFFEKKIKYRMRSSFFPFTEPSMEIDMLFAQDKWIEILGCGMVHTNVLKGLNIASKYTGFAFGIGIERLAMLFYGFADIRKLYEGDFSWLERNGSCYL